MALADIRLILDTNTLLRGIAKPQSASGRLLAAADERQVLLLASKRVVDEYRLILLDSKIRERHPLLSSRTVELTLRNLVYFSEYIDTVRIRFSFPRDPKDEKFLALAIAGRASHLISFDNDLLSLPTSHGDAARRLRQRLPRLRIQTPREFMVEYGSEFPRF